MEARRFCNSSSIVDSSSIVSATSSLSWSRQRLRSLKTVERRAPSLWPTCCEYPPDPGELVQGDH